MGSFCTFFPQGMHPSRWTDDGGYSHIFTFSVSEWETKLGVYLRVRILAQSVDGSAVGYTQGYQLSLSKDEGLIDIGTLVPTGLAFVWFWL